MHPNKSTWLPSSYVWTFKSKQMLRHQNSLHRSPPPYGPSLRYQGRRYQVIVGCHLLRDTWRKQCFAAQVLEEICVHRSKSTGLQLSNIKDVRHLTSYKPCVWVTIPTHTSGLSYKSSLLIAHITGGSSCTTRKINQRKLYYYSKESLHRKICHQWPRR